MPEFSIIVPTFNSEATLGRLISSVLLQTYTDFELLIIDGCSSDDTVDIVQQYSSKDKRIRWISERDKGVYDAMNKGIGYSKGTWLYFIGSDDFFSNENVLTDIAEGIKRSDNEPDIIYGNVFFPPTGEVFDGPFDMVKICKYNMSHQAMFYKREVFSEMGLYNLKYKILSDWDFNLRCFFNPRLSKKYINVCVAHYSTTGISSQTEDKDFKKDWFPLIRKIGYKQLPLKILKFYCHSNFQFLLLLFKRMFIPLKMDDLRATNTNS